MPLVVRWRLRRCRRRRMLASAVGTTQVIWRLSLAILQMLLGLVLLIGVVVVVRTVGRLVAVAELRWAAEGIVVRDCILGSHAVLFAFSELFDIQPDLLGQKLRQLLVDAVSPGEIGGQPARAVAFVDVDVLILPIANLNRDCQEFLIASLALRRLSLARLLYLGEALAELRCLICVRHTALLGRYAAVGVLAGAACYLGGRDLVDGSKSLRKVRVLVKRVLVGHRLLTVSYICVARHWIDRRNIRLSQEVLRIIVVANIV